MTFTVTAAGATLATGTRDDATGTFTMTCAEDPPVIGAVPDITTRDAAGVLIADREILSWFGDTAGATIAWS